jgi:hypothetical protein
MFKLVLVLSFVLSGCFASTVPDAQPSPECPAVECAWAADGACAGEYSSENTREDMGDGTACFVFTASCVTERVDAACVPASCKQNQFATCAGQP